VGGRGAKLRRTVYAGPRGCGKAPGRFKCGAGASHGLAVLCESARAAYGDLLGIESPRDWVDLCDAIFGRGRRMSMNRFRARQVAILGAEGEMYRGRRLAGSEGAGCRKECSMARAVVVMEGKTAVSSQGGTDAMR
jgi:hypothetical protein